MTRKKWRIKRVMAVPATWQGTPERFYHFLLGYFVPLVLWQERTGADEVAVRDSGPMNPWFDLLRPGTNTELMPPGVMLERLLSHRQERVVFHDWDNPTRFHRRALAHATSAVLGRTASGGSSEHRVRPRITILERRPSTSYYRSETAELQGGGADWRSIPNLGEVAAALEAIADVAIVDTAGMAPLQQIQAVRHSDLLIGQHGGGLSNMIWLPPRAGVVEILPPLPQTINTIFRNLAAARRLGYHAIPQEDTHAEVSTHAVAEAATRILGNPTESVPTPTGRLPIRMLRQLPRRL